MRVRLKSDGIQKSSSPHQNAAVGSSYRDKTYRVLVADPSWQFSDGLGKRGAQANYKTLPLNRIKAFPLPKLADDCVLFLWRVTAMQKEAFDVIESWGFEFPEREMVWRKLTVNGKDHFGMGYLVRNSHETCLIAVRGKMKPKVRNIRSLFSASVPQADTGRPKHSAKPDKFFHLVRQLFDGPRASLFERRQRYGFDCYGDEM